MTRGVRQVAGYARAFSRCCELAVLAVDIAPWHAHVESDRKQAICIRTAAISRRRFSLPQEGTNSCPTLDAAQFEKATAS